VAKVDPIYSINEANKIPPQIQVYHNNDGCLVRRSIPASERVPGTMGYKLCLRCSQLD